jgi:MSHA biogenesis protein MshM
VFLSHFRLNSDPFAVALDPAFFYPGPDHREALAALYYVVTQRRGCGMLLGETGMGKTLVLRYLRKLLGPAAETVILAAPMDGSELLEAICRAFSVEGAGLSRHARLAALEERFTGKRRQDRRAVLARDGRC